MDECVLMGLLTAAWRGSRAAVKIGRLLAVARTRTTLMVLFPSRRYAASDEGRVCSVRLAKMSGGEAVPLMTSSKVIKGSSQLFLVTNASACAHSASHRHAPTRPRQPYAIACCPPRSLGSLASST